MLKDARTYEIMSAAAIGAEGTRLVLGKHSGRHALRQRLEALGLLLTQEELNHAFMGFKSLAGHKQEVTDEDLVRIAEHGRRAADGVFDAIGHVYR
jgi:2-isopropylmalate synthase